MRSKKTAKQLHSITILPLFYPTLHIYSPHMRVQQVIFTFHAFLQPKTKETFAKWLMTQVEFAVLKQHCQCSMCKYFLCYCCCLGASCCAAGKCARITHTTPRLMATKSIGAKGSQYACQLHALLSFNLLGLHSAPFATSTTSSKWQVAMAMGLAMGTAMAMAMAMAPALVFLCPVSGSALLCLPRLSRNVARVFVAASFAIIWSICCLALSLLNLAFACYTSRACGDSQPAGYRISREYSAPPPELFFHWLVFSLLSFFFFVYDAAGSYSIIW